MKKVDILKEAEKIENDYRIIREPTKTVYGIAVRLTGDPYVEISLIDYASSRSHKFKIGRKRYDKESYILLPQSKWKCFKDVVEELLNAEV